MTAKIHMVTGLTGAGKSTYSETLALDENGVRFSIDDWMSNLFFMERDVTTDFDWFYERVQRCTKQMRDAAELTLRTKTPVIFDCGFTNSHERGLFYDWADDLGYSVALHYLDVDHAVRWQRVQSRNEQQGATFALNVTREMFDFMQNIWEAPSPDEMKHRNGCYVN